MQPKSVTLAIAAFMLVITPAAASCPPGAQASLPEAIEANGRRVVCIQNELSDATRQRKYQEDIKALERRIQSLETQRLTTPAAPIFTPRPVFP
jgi:hypothetical protein